MGLGNAILILALLPVYGFGIALHFDLIDSGEMFHIQDMVNDASVEYQSNLLMSSAFMSGDSEGLIQHASISLGLAKVLVDPNEEPNSGDEYFDNLINECIFHSDESIEGNICVVCKLVDTEIPCKDMWIDFEELEHGTEHQEIVDHLKDNFGITLTVDGENGIDEAIIYDSRFNGGFDFDLEHPLKPGDDPSVGNLLVMRENSNNQPNDSGKGGTLTFELDRPWFLESVDVVDHDNKGESSVIRAYQTEDCTGNFVEADIVEKNFENSLQKVVVNANNVSCFEIIYFDSGGFTNIHLRCIPCEGDWIDFEELEHGTEHQEIVDHLKNNFGITLTVDGKNGIDEAIIYDSRFLGPGAPNDNTKNGFDFDLEHPLMPDDLSVGNLLVMRENSNNQPNDSGQGGTLTFQLDNPMFLESVDVVDHDNRGESSVIRAYQTQDCTGNFVEADIVEFNKERSLQRVFVNANNVSCFEIIYFDSGGFTNIHLTCVENGDMKKKFNPENIIAKGIKELENGYTASEKVTIPFDKPADVQEAMAVVIKVFRNQIETGELSVGDIIVADDNRDAIIKVDPVTGEQTIISDDSDFDDPENLLIDNQGRLLVAEGDFPGSSGPGTIFIVNPDGSLSIFTTGGLFDDGPEDLVEDAFGNIYVADDSGDDSGDDGKVIKVTPGGVQSLVAELNYNGGKLEGITLDNSGDIIVVGGTGDGAKVSKIDPVTGDETVISDISDVFDDNKLLRPEGVAVAANGDIFVADGNPGDNNDLDIRGQIVKVNPDGTLTVIISTTNPNGPDWENGEPWVDPSDVEILPNGFLLVTDDAADDDGGAGMGALIQVNPANGDTKIISANGFFDSPEGLFIVPPRTSICEKLPHDL